MEATRDNKGRFVAGKPINLSPEERLEITRSIKKTWSEKDTYIRDLAEKNPYIFNSWRGIKYTNKGRAAGCEWSDFKAFFEDVSPTYKDGLILRRKDDTIPFSKDNFVWVTPQEAAQMKRTTRLITYNGETKTILQWAQIYNMSATGISLRMRRHPEYTAEQMIFGVRVNRGSKQPKDWRVSSMTQRQKASKMIAAYKHIDLKNNYALSDITIDWFIDNIMNQPCVYCGDTKQVGCDRIDNGKGHTMDNVVPCCFDCNCARNNRFSHEEMFVIGKAIRQVKENRK